MARLAPRHAVAAAGLILAPRSDAGQARTPLRDRVAQAFTFTEDFFYLGLGLLLAGTVATLLVKLAASFWGHLAGGTLTDSVVPLLDQILLILMIGEILYTVQVSFREHVLVPEPFVLVALIAGVRRILVVTAEFAKLLEKGDAAFRNAMIELALLIAMTLALVGCLVALRKRHPAAVAERA